MRIRKKLSGDNDIAVYRYHDVIRKKMPDGIMTGLLSKKTIPSSTEQTGL